ncbi:MAG: Ig-like domain-containing protein, partial [Clostridiales Family XIII bacterium]|nr:Ig-like domain-containing protein [Clostridiales Family XIII bacterium]
DTGTGGGDTGTGGGDTGTGGGDTGTGGGDTGTGGGDTGTGGGDTGTGGGDTGTGGGDTGTGGGDTGTGGGDTGTGGGDTGTGGGDTGAGGGGTDTGNGGGDNTGVGSSNGNGDNTGGISAPAKVIGFGASQKTVYVQSGKKVRIPYIVYAAADGSQSITWSSTKPKLAAPRLKAKTGQCMVNANQNAVITIMTAKKKVGKAKITLTDGSGQKLTITIKVVKKAKITAKKSVKIKGAPKTIKAGQTAILKAAFTKKATGAVVTWKSSNPSVATIDAAGKLTAKAKGTATITLKVGGKKKKAKISVIAD